MGCEPLAEVIASKGYVLPGFVSGVDLGMHCMCVRHCRCQDIVYMSREASEAGLVPEETMDIDQQQCSSILPC